MRRLIVRTFSSALLTVTLLIVSPVYVAAQNEGQARSSQVVRRPIPPGASKGLLNFARTELFFGTAREGGVPVSDEDFLAFVDAQVTPRFPDGLTLLNGSGQFRNSAGVIVKEESWVLILLYSLDGFTDSSRRIDTIRELYKAQFDQESVLRVDDPWAARVSF